MSDKGPLPRTVEHPNGDYELLNRDGQTVLYVTAAEMDSIVSEYEAHIASAIKDGHRMESPLDFLFPKLIHLAHERGQLAALLKTIVCESTLKARP